MRLGALALCVILARTLGAQGGVSLLVIDDATDAPLPSVQISVAGNRNEGLTDQQGRYFYPTMKPGKVIFLLRRLGYTPGTLTVDVVANDTARATFAMTAAPQTLSTVAVRDTMASVSPFLRDFERRVAAHAGSATYITRDEIQKRNPGRTTDLLRRVSSITIADSQGVLMAVSRRIQKPVVGRGPAGVRVGAPALAGGGVDLADCPLQVAIDGQVKEWGYAVNSISPNEIHGIEIYPGPATIPAEYASMRRDAACGLILIWTRRDK